MCSSYVNFNGRFVLSSMFRGNTSHFANSPSYSQCSRAHSSTHLGYKSLPSFVTLEVEDTEEVDQINLIKVYLEEPIVVILLLLVVSYVEDSITLLFIVGSEWIQPIKHLILLHFHLLQCLILSSFITNQHLSPQSCFPSDSFVTP